MSTPVPSPYNAATGGVTSKHKPLLPLWHVTWIEGPTKKETWIRAADPDALRAEIHRCYGEGCMYSALRLDDGHWCGPVKDQRTAPQIGPETPQQESARAKEEDAGACHGNPGSPRPHAAAQSLYGSPLLGTCQRCGTAQSWLYSVRCDELCIRCIARGGAGCTSACSTPPSMEA